MPRVRIELDQDKFNSMLLNGALEGVKYEIKEVVIEDDLFKDDSIYQELKSKSINAYKDLKKYEFNKRTNHKN
jgi:hypothetical protein